MRDRGPAARLALLALAAAVVASAAMLALPLDRDELRWLYDGRKFSGEAALEIQKALAVEKVAFQADSAHRIGVAASRWGDAMAALEKHGVEPPSLEELEKDRPTSDVWSDRDDRAALERWRLERWLKASIEGYAGGIRSAHVSIKRSLVGTKLRPEWKVGGLVLLDVERRPPHRVIRSIQTLLASKVDGLAPESVTIGDQSGNFFLDASNPGAASATRVLARAEELRDALLVKLTPLVPGIDVDVTVDPPSPSDPPAKAHPVPKRSAPPAAELEQGVRPNMPVGLEPDPAPAPAEPAGPGRASIWVKVPRSYYLRIARDNAPGRTPSQDDLKVYHQKTCEQVDHAVAVLIPPPERGRVMVDIIQDALVADPAPADAPASVDAARAWPNWVAPAALGAGAGLGVAVVLGTGVGLLASRRPSARPSRSSVRSGLSVDAPSGPVPGPSERVRDLVRRDPEAAAGVLQRWIGRAEGGSHS
jgi:flagellar M-ring protein FliF